ncbi:hypothetical protein [Actinoplanes sp. G11-F43]|uniref:hypothetical protein n=1 Tax=Actinoplanes sp. G11-F43 TaxID=3424130 RepID=UPI003D329C71
MGKKRKADSAAAVRARTARDRQYRQQLGIAPDEPLPAQLGTGLPADGTGVYRGRDRKPAPARRARQWAGKYTPAVTVTADQVRSFACPRCLAKAGDPCRDQRGRAYSRGHAERIELARRREVSRLRRLGKRDEAAESRNPAHPSRTPARAEPRPAATRIDPGSGKQVRSAADAVGWSLDRKRVLRTDDGTAPRAPRAVQPAKVTSAPADRQARALASPCRRCRALAGQPCRGKDGTTPVATHPRRGLPAPQR